MVSKYSHAAVIFFGLFLCSGESEGKIFYIKYVLLCCLSSTRDKIFFSSSSILARNSRNFSVYNSFYFLFQFELHPGWKYNFVFYSPPKDFYLNFNMYVYFMLKQKSNKVPAFSARISAPKLLDPCFWGKSAPLASFLAWSSTWVERQWRKRPPN